MVAKKRSRAQDDDIEYIDSNESSDIVQKKIEKLQKDLKACQEERQEYLDGWQRLRADVANKNRDDASTSERARRAAEEEFAANILPILDSFDMAFRGEAWESVDGTWRKGVEYIHAQLVSALSQYNIAPFGAIGDVFDPTIHEAGREDDISDKGSDGVITEVIQLGYKAGDKVLRPARVAVGRLKN